MTDYALTVTLPVAFDEAVAATRVALAEQGFGVLTEIDVAATMKAKLGADLPPHVILGACNPPLAHRALSIEPAVGLLLPCNVTVRYLDEKHTEVAAMNPDVLVAVTGAPDLGPVAGEARTRLEAALARLRRSH